MCTPFTISKKEKKEMLQRLYVHIVVDPVSLLMFREKQTAPSLIVYNGECDLDYCDFRKLPAEPARLVSFLKQGKRLAC